MYECEVFYSQEEISLVNILLYTVYICQPGSLVQFSSCIRVCKLTTKHTMMYNVCTYVHVFIATVQSHRFSSEHLFKQQLSSCSKVLMCSIVVCYQLKIRNLIKFPQTVTLLYWHFLIRNYTKQEVCVPYTPYYRNLSFFRCENIFVHIKTYKNVLREYYSFITKIFLTMTHQQQRTTSIAAAHISLYMQQPLTQQAVSFSPAISLARVVISSINAHHTRLIKLFSFNILVCTKTILREYFLTKIYQIKKV